MCQYLFYLFVLQRVRQLYIPCLWIIRSTLSKIPFLFQIQDTAKNTDVASYNLTGPGFAWSRSISVILSWYLPWDERISTVINTKIRIFLNGRSQSRINGVLKSSFLESRTPVTHRFNDTVDVLFRCITIYIKNNRLYGFYQFPPHVSFFIFRPYFQPPSFDNRFPNSRLIPLKTLLADRKISSGICSNCLQRSFWQ